jgi:hypothetical protein
VARRSSASGRAARSTGAPEPNQAHSEPNQAHSEPLRPFREVGRGDLVVRRGPSRPAPPETGPRRAPFEREGVAPGESEEAQGTRRAMP